MDIFLVGGAVRDMLLEYPVKEQDWVVVGATPEALIQQGYEQVGKDFPVFLHPKTKDEYALARTERKTQPGYTGFEFHAAADVTLEQDLARRDLTINAIAQAEDGSLVDPYGGQRDIHNRVLRHVSHAFCEDPVRILRIARFAARYHHLGFTIADETLELMKAMVASGEVDALVAERVWKETVRALGEQNPHVYFDVLRQCHALKRIMPELDALFGVPQPKAHHPEIDTGVHALLSLQQATRLSKDCRIRFAALIHDLGKALTPEDKWPRHHGHEKAGIPPIKSLCKRLTAPNDYRQLALWVCEFHTHCHQAHSLKASTLVDLFQSLSVYKKPQLIHDFGLACKADARGRTGFENCEYPQAEYLQQTLAACQTIDSAPFLAQGLTGPAIGKAIREERIRRVKRYIKDLPKEGIQT